jgi:hypothetical protein
VIAFAAHGHLSGVVQPDVLLTRLPILLVTAVAATLGGCRHPQSYRGAFSGRIVDRSGNPVRGATVVVCTASDSQPFTGCPRRAEAWTDPDGRFQFSPVKESAWGDVRPTTRLTACGRDGTGRFLLASSVEVDASGATEPLVSVAPPDGPATRNACVSPE